MAGRRSFDIPDTSVLPPHELEVLLRDNSLTTRLNPFPKLLVTNANDARDAVMEVLSHAKAEGRVGLDLEFTPSGKATILGVSARHVAAGVPFESSLAREVLDTGLPIAGHAVTTADKGIIDKMLDIDTPLASWNDTMLKHYLCNQDFCAMPGKDEDDDDQGALGLMNLYTMASHYLGVPQWKICRDEMCFGPCPKHKPFHYCAVDSWAGLEGDYRLDEDMQRKNIPMKFYEELQRLDLYCDRMKRQGVRVDTDLVRDLEAEFERRKEAIFPSEPYKKTRRFGHWGPPDEWGEIIWQDAPFNPRAPKATAEYFAQRGIILKDRGGKDSINKAIVGKALDKILKPFGLKYDPKVHVVRNAADEFVEDLSALPTHVEELIRLAQYKGSGKGLKSWFNEEYIDKYGFAHPRFIVTGTSTGRLSSSGPNFQNIPRVGFGSLVRRVIVPRERGLGLVKADYSQLELRVCLWYAGQLTGKLEMPVGDAFNWLVSESGGKFDSAAARLGLSARDIAKSVSHAGDYLEGLVVLTERDLASKRRQEELRAGALLAFDGRDSRPLWHYRGGIVCFTGANLAERLFGSRTFENRQKALGIQEIYFERFASIRRWHQHLSAFIESHGYIQSHTGRYISLYGSPEDDLKLAAAFLGQGGGADIAQEAMLRYDALDELATLQVHDELLFEKPLDWTDRQCYDLMQIMSLPSERFPGLACPTKAYRGLRWRERTKDKKTGEWTSPDDELMEIRVD